MESKITKISFLKMGEGSSTKVSYQDTLIAFADTENLEGKKLQFHLCKQDEKGQEVIKETITATVDRYARAEVRFSMPFDEVAKLLSDRQQESKDTFYIKATTNPNSEQLLAFPKSQQFKITYDDVMIKYGVSPVKVYVEDKPVKTIENKKIITLLITKVKGPQYIENIKVTTKATYEVIEYNNPNRVTQEDKDNIKWKIKIDDKEEDLSQKGEKIELILKKEWRGKSIIVMPYLKTATEKVSVKTDISSFVDDYPIFFVTRSYAPFKTFGPWDEWYGDNRAPSLNIDASYRTSVTIEYKIKSRRVITKGGKTRSHTIDGKKDAISETFVRNRTPQGGGITFFDVYSYGGNAAQFGAPNVDQFTFIMIIIEGKLQEDHILHIVGNIKGDDFPNQESIIYDSKKNTLWLGLFKTKGDKNSGPVTDLWFENEKDVNISINIRIKVSNEGIFKGVMQEGKMITIDEWNAKFK